MTTAITLAGPDHRPQLLALMERRDVEAGGSAWSEADTGRAIRAIGPLLLGGPEGAVWLIGPVRAPLGYTIATFGWSLLLAGREAWIEDVFVRQSVRQRGIGTEVLHAVAVALRQADVRALHVRLPDAAPAAIRFFGKAGFARKDDIRLMTDML